MSHLQRESRNFISDSTKNKKKHNISQSSTLEKHNLESHIESKRPFYIFALSSVMRARLPNIHAFKAIKYYLNLDVCQNLIK